MATKKTTNGALTISLDNINNLIGIMLMKEYKIDKKEIFDTSKILMEGVVVASISIKQKSIDRSDLQTISHVLMQYNHLVNKFLQKEFLKDCISTEKFAVVVCSYLDNTLTNIQLDKRISAIDNPTFDKNEFYAQAYSMSFYVKSLINVFHFFCPTLEIKNPIEYNEDDIKTQNQSVSEDNRYSTKMPSNAKRIKALKEFCPELIQRLAGKLKIDQEIIINLITGVNKVDSYKLSFGNRQSESKKQIIDNLEELKKKIDL